MALKPQIDINKASNEKSKLRKLRVENRGKKLRRPEGIIELDRAREGVRESVYSIEGLRGSSELLCTCLSCMSLRLGSYYCDQ